MWPVLGLTARVAEVVDGSQVVTGAGFCVVEAVGMDG